MTLWEIIVIVRETNGLKRMSLDNIRGWKRMLWKRPSAAESYVWEGLYLMRVDVPRKIVSWASHSSEMKSGHRDLYETSKHEYVIDNKSTKQTHPDMD